jgi:hypothetical protein
MKHPTKPLASIKLSLHETRDRSRFRGDPA